MPTRRTAAPASEPVTLAEAKLHLRVDHSADDALIASLITAARKKCEDLLGRSLIDQQWTLTLDSFPDAIRLYYPRVTAVTELRYTDTTGLPQVLNPADYVLDTSSEHVAWVVPASGTSWPDTPDDRVNCVEVVYQSGPSLGAIQEDVKECIRTVVAFNHANREITKDFDLVERYIRSALSDYWVPGV